MKVFENIITFIFATLSIVAGFTFPIEYEALGTNCINTSGEKGVYKLSVDCKVKDDPVAFVKFVGPVVCCVEQMQQRQIITARSFCSQFGANASTSMMNKIVGGEESDVGEFPFMAAIGYRNLDEDTDFDCGGAIVSEKFVLTVGHCANLKGKQPKLVRLGRTSLNLRNFADHTVSQDIDILHIHLPKDYSAQYKYEDIALLELKTPISFNDNIKPICLFSNESKTYYDDYTIIGFGVANITTRTKSDWLMKANLRGIPNEDCSKKYKDINLRSLPQGIKDSQICAAGMLKPDGTYVDTCQGDSGSPLIVSSYREDKSYLFGMTSFGLGCGSQFPSIYTRISSKVSWIESIVWPQS